MSRLDQRVRAVELRPISLLTSDQVNAAVELGEVTAGPESLVSANAPWQFRKIQDAYLYPKALTGTEDRVEIYLESDLNLSVGDRIEVSGIHGATDLDIDVTSDNFTVAYVDTPPWDGRQVGSGSNQITKHSPEDDQLTGVTITNTYSFKPETLAPQTLSSETRLQTRRKVDTYSITGTAVTLTMNANHKFQEGDVIFVDIFSEDSRAYGLDGLFYVTAVTDDTIEYTLDAGVDTPTGDVDVSTADVYVFPVAREWAQYGSTWIDSSTNQVYWWNGIRLVEYTPGAVEGDGDPPSAPTGLNASFEMGYGPNGGNVAVIRATLSWTAPTTSESGAELTDLLSYRIQYQLDPSGSWTTLPDISDPSLTSFTFGELFTFEKSTPSTTKTYNFRVYAIDSGGEVSEAATASADTPEAPATNIETVKPVLSNDPPYLGTVTIYWNGTVKDALGTTQSNPEGMYYVEFHRSTNATFTASDSTLIGTVAAVPNAKFVDGSLSNAYGTTFYYVAVIVDGNGTRSVQSDPPLAVTAQSSVDVAAIQGIIDAAGITPGTIVAGEEIIGLNITGQLIRGVEINAGIIEANSITADKLDVGNVTAQIINSKLFTTRTITSEDPPAYTGPGITIDDVGITAWSNDTVPVPKFFVNAANGHVSIASGMTIGDITDAYDAANAAASTANSAASTANSASSTANSAASGVGDLEDNVYYTGTTEIDGGNIRTDTVQALSFTATALSDHINRGQNTHQMATDPNLGVPRVSFRSDGIFAFNSGGSATFRVYGNSGDIYTTGAIQAGGSITGANFYSTSSSLNKITVSASTNDITFNTATGAVGGRIVGSTFPYNSVGIVGNNGGAAYFGAGTVQFTASSTTAGYTFQGSTIPVIVEDLKGTTVSTVGTTINGKLYRSSSDRRLKSEIISTTTGLDFINDLNPVEFKWRPKDLGSNKNYGFIAQDVEEILEKHGIDDQSMVYKLDSIPESYKSYIPESDTPYGFEINQLVPVLVKAIQELSNKLDLATARLDVLEGN